MTITPDRLYSDIEHLVIRLEHGITPNAVEFSVEDRRPAELVEIINAIFTSVLPVVFVYSQSKQGIGMRSNTQMTSTARYLEGQNNE